MNLKYPYILASLLLSLFFLVIPIAHAEKLSKLDKIHLNILKKHKQVKHVSALFEATPNPDELILLDVREASEFAVSRIHGAVRVSPDISTSDFLDQYGPEAEGKSYVFYCSVGRRSSELIKRVQKGLLSKKANSVHNLEGGIFKWHNEARSLVDQGGHTDYVHPYSFWGKRMLERDEYTSYKPK